MVGLVHDLFIMQIQYYQEGKQYRSANAVADLGDFEGSEYPSACEIQTNYEMHKLLPQNCSNFKFSGGLLYDGLQV